MMFSNHSFKGTIFQIKVSGNIIISFSFSKFGSEVISASFLEVFLVSSEGVSLYVSSESSDLFACSSSVDLSIVAVLPP